MVRVAIIGLGAVTRNIHLSAYAQLKDRVRVVAGSDIADDARKAAMQWGVPAVFDDPSEMIRRTKPDVIAVCTPPAAHFEHTLLALRHGCHVFCEKPLTDSLEKADEIIYAADQSGRRIVVNCQFPYMQIHLAAKKLIGSTQFGRLLFLQAWQSFRPSDVTEMGWRGEMKRRVCFEFGVHVFELIRFFFDDSPVKLSAQMPQLSADLHTDALNIVTTEFEDGRAACMILNRISKGPERYLDMRLDGENASIHTSIGGKVEFAAGLHTKTRRPFVKLDFAKGGRAVLENRNRSRVIAKDNINPFASATARHFRSFADALDEGAVPSGSAADHRKTLALVFAAYDAATSGQTVDVNRYAPRPSNASVGAFKHSS
jgi:D-apiose dehydrogenase